MTSNTGIPLRLHQFWIEPGLKSSSEAKLHDDVAIISKTWDEFLPDHKVWSSDEVAMMILEDLGDVKQRLFLNCKLPAMRADIARIFLVWRFGGIYSDVRWALFGSTPEQRSQSWENLKSLLDSHSFVGLNIMTANQNIMIQNSFFAATPKNPILSNTLNLAFDFINNPKPRHQDVWWLTGRRLMTVLLEWPDKTQFYIIPHKQSILTEKKSGYKRNIQYRWQIQQRDKIYYDTESLPW